jgi:DNA-binding CsgD family transcriptional regulator/tetratricopeptide (TPR) repeat protein
MAFIGRERELEELGSALQRASEGEPTRVAISGPLGIGVSRLIDELEERLQRSNSKVTVCRARCVAPTSGIPYGALRVALGEILERVQDDRLEQVLGSGTHDLVTLVPRLAERLERLGIEVRAPRLDARDQRGARVRESLFGVIGRLAAQRLLVLVIEDIEHSDPGTRGFVSALLRVRRRLPLALIIGYHTDELPRGHPALSLAHEIEDSAHIEHLPLAPLTRDETSAMVEDIQGERPTLGFVAAVVEGSRGNPLIASQLVAAEAELAGLRLSDPFDEVLLARVEQLDAGTARALRVLAAAHRPMTLEELSRVRLADGHLARNAAAAATASGLALETSRGVAVIHELCAEALESSLLPPERHVVHAALADLTAAEPAEAAWHWERAARPRQARDAHLAAAAMATEVEPAESALLHYAGALELSETGQEVDVALLREAAAAASAAVAFRRAASYIEQALRRVAGGRVEKLLAGPAGKDGKDAADRADARAVAAELSEQLGQYLRGGGDSVAAQEAFESAVELAPSDASSVRAHALAALAQNLMIDGRFDESAEIADQARTTARIAGSAGQAAYAHASDTLAVDRGWMGDIDGGLALLEEAMTAARKVGRLDEVMRCYANRTTLLDLDSRREEALAVVKEGMAEASRSGLGLTYGAFLRGNAADILFQLGRWPESEAECRAAMEFPPAGVAWFSPTLYLGLVMVESRADEESSRLVGQTLLQLETVPAGQWSALVLRIAVSDALWRGELVDARNAAEQGWQRVLETDDPAQLAYAASTVLEACAASSERGRLKRDWSEVADAGELAGRVLPDAERAVKKWHLPKSVGARREAELHLATARAHAARVKGKISPEAWAGLADAWSEVPLPYQVAKARWWQAQAALPTRARRGEARRALTEAWRIASELPAGPLQKALRDLAVRGRIALPDTDLVAVPIEAEPTELVAVGPGRAKVVDFGIRVPGSGLSPAEARFGLSPRENSVLLVLAEGRTNREIAERLFISERTVAVHVRRILAKLGVAGRTEAAGMAIRLGLVPGGPGALDASRIGSGVSPAR